jgi:hypothetical protein
LLSLRSKSLTAPPTRRTHLQPRTLSACAARTQDPAHYSTQLDIERHDIEQDDEPSLIRRQDIVREIAQRQRVTPRRAQQLVKQQIERAAHGDLFIEAGGAV